MHPLDTLAQLDLARQGHDRDRSVQEATHRRAMRLRAEIATRLHGRRRPPRHR